MQGIYPHGTDSNHINGVAREPQRKLIATGDDYGFVNVYRDPCLEDFCTGRSYRGHSEHVLRVEFAADGKYLLSLGGYDQTLIQWRLVGEVSDNESEYESESEEEEVTAKEISKSKNTVTDNAVSHGEESKHNSSAVESQLKKSKTNQDSSLPEKTITEESGILKEGSTTNLKLNITPINNKTVEYSQGEHEEIEDAVKEINEEYEEDHDEEEGDA